MNEKLPDRPGWWRWRAYASAEWVVLKVGYVYGTTLYVDGSVLGWLGVRRLSAVGGEWGERVIMDGEEEE